MKGFKPIHGTGKYGMLVFVRVPRNIMWDDSLKRDIFEYDKKPKPGIIIEVSDYFEDYYLVMFFDTSRSYHWGSDIFLKKEENDLTYLTR